MTSRFITTPVLLPKLPGITTEANLSAGGNLTSARGQRQMIPLEMQIPELYLSARQVRILQLAHVLLEPLLMHGQEEQRVQEKEITFYLWTEQMTTHILLTTLFWSQLPQSLCLPGFIARVRGLPMPEQW